ncbi:MAG: hypothetical protein MJ165_01895 [Alphaproteobacteria bacterium]|nr:hypothetical protein [Alphaproteobacteria bacterium]
MGVIKNKIKKATTKLALMESMEKLKKDLQKLGPIPNSKDVYDYGVKFFNIIASFQDANAVDFELFKEKTEDAKILATHIRNAGCNEYGWVRAQRGEPVTLHNLYLGNVYGLWTKTAAFWKEMPDKDVQSIKNASNIDVQMIIQNQLSSFIESHREPMIDLITKILNSNKKPDNFIVKKMYERNQKDK